MFSPLRRGARLPMTVLALALAAWSLTGQAAFAHGGGGGGGHGGGGHGGGGHGGGHSGGHHSGGYHHGGYGGHHGYYPNYYFGGGYGGYGYGYGYNYPYYNYGYGYTYPNYTYSYPSGYYSAYGSTAAPLVSAAPTQGRFLGIDEQPVVDAAGNGMQVVRVYSGSAAEQAGLQAGDVIYSANGYLTQQHGNLTWIIGTVPSNGELRMNVRTARDGAVHAVTARLP
jgi:PDZ domain